jgi:hypothetical protein
MTQFDIETMGELFAAVTLGRFYWADQISRFPPNRNSLIRVKMSRAFEQFVLLHAVELQVLANTGHDI